MEKQKVIIDCDPGNDDGMAILMACAAPNLEVLGISTVAGNLNAETTARNAQMLTEYFGIRLPITAGAYPLMKEYEPLDVSVMGESGLGRAVLPTPQKPLDPRTSVELLRDTIEAHPGEVDILALAPLTNIALLLLQYPAIRKDIRRIVLMGGAVESGNMTPRTEFNIYTDAEAARIVFRSGIPLTMIGIDVCGKTAVTAADMERLTAHGGKAAKFVADMMFYPGDAAHPFPEQGILIYDALAAAALIDPACVTTYPYYVDVETKGELTYGETVVDVHGFLKKEPNIDVAMESDTGRFLELMAKTIAHYDGE